jgi:Tetrapyrrole (Corrin/Porphyrin) Methylases
MTVAPRCVDLYLLGAGVAFPDHLTLQTIDILSACRRICTNLPETRLSTLPADLREKCVSLWPLYQDGRLRWENYRDVTQAVLDEVENARPVAWLTPGHPTIFDSVTSALLQVVPAISSIDTLLAELAYDPASGLAIHDATGLVRRKIPLLRSVALLLLQISVFMSDRAHISLAQGRPDLNPLRDYLVKYFPSTHKCAMVRSSSVLTEPPKITWIALSDLPSVPVDVSAGASLFVPRMEPQQMTGVWNKLQALQPGVFVSIPDANESGRIEASSGTIAASPSDGDYVDGAIIPTCVWRDLSADERKPLCGSDIVCEDGAKISLVTFPQEMLNRFREVRELASRFELDEVRRKVSRPAFCDAIRLCSEYVRDRFALGVLDEAGQIAGGIGVNAANLRTVTVDPHTRKFVGLHVDNWSRLPLNQRRLAPKRICINIGNGARYLLFVNLSIRQLLADALGAPARQVHAPYRAGTEIRQDVLQTLDRTGAGTALGRAFMACSPVYPVLRLKIYPGEAYIAPTENLIHDGSSSGTHGPDVYLSLREVAQI